MSCLRGIFKDYALLLFCTVLHFSVDGVCGAALAEAADRELFWHDIGSCVVLYTLLAFGTQGLLGFLLDRSKKYLKLWLAFGLLLFVLSVPACGALAQIVFLGLGNSVFHVTAGSIILEKYSSFSAPGIFVASGALGLALGLQGIASTAVMLVLCSAATAALLYTLPKRTGVSFENVKAESMNIHAFLGIALLSGCVILRGFSGSVSLDDMPLWLSCIYAGGKALGGLCCDKFGYRKTVLFNFIGCFAALQFCGLLPLLAFVLLCNMTMPLTLRLLHHYCPGYPGTMFGLAAGFLLPGVLFKDSYLSLPLLALLQYVLLSVGGYYYEKNYK